MTLKLKLINKPEKYNLKGVVQPKLIWFYFSCGSQKCRSFCTPMTRFPLTAGWHHRTGPGWGKIVNIWSRCTEEPGPEPGSVSASHSCSLHSPALQSEQTAQRGELSNQQCLIAQFSPIEMAGDRLIGSMLHPPR